MKIITQKDMRKFWKILYFVNVVFLSTLIFAPVSFAEDNELPNAMVGQTVLFRDHDNYYFGMNGNFAIINYYSEYLGADTNELFGYSYSRLAIDCYRKNWFSFRDRCFMPSPTTTGMRVMISRTYFKNNTNPTIETPVLYYPPITVMGDVYGNNLDLSNFAFYGRNLGVARGVGETPTSPTWRATDYVFNPDSQSYYGGDSESWNYINNRINLLSGEAIINNASAGKAWYLQSDENLNVNAYDAVKYPQGRVFKHSDPNSANPENLTLNSGLSYNYKYHDIGTIIIDGDLIVEKGVNILKGDPSQNSISNESSLGIVVKGNVILKGNNKIEAAIFCMGASGIVFQGGGVEMRGSFVAKDFDVYSDDERTVTYSGIRFYYDPKLNTNWPPGFRYFSMPSAQASVP